MTYQRITELPDSTTDAGNQRGPTKRLHDSGGSLLTHGHESSIKQQDREVEIIEDYHNDKVEDFRRVYILSRRIAPGDRPRRPYACTFPRCQNGFASKKDWVRHETSTHCQSELWRCGEQGCTKVFSQVVAFKTHLIEAHKLGNIEEIVDHRRFGPTSRAHFWCSFCKQVVNLDDKNVDAWTEQFDHIDVHFMGRNGNEKRSILSWVHVDGEGSEGVQVSPRHDDFMAKLDLEDGSLPPRSPMSRKASKPVEVPQIDVYDPDDVGLRDSSMIDDGLVMQCL
jgi:hypothetical protein